MKSDVFNKTLFWDVDPEKLDYRKDKQFIIERVFVRGGMKAVVEIFKTYTINEIVEAVKNSRNLDAVTHNFCSNYFNIPKHQMNAPSQYY